MSDSHEPQNQIFSFREEVVPRTTRSVYLKEAVSECIAEFTKRFTCNAIDVVVDIPANLTFTTNESLFHSAIECLCEEAITNMPSGGELVFTSVVQDRALELEIADSRQGYLQSPRIYSNSELQDETDALQPVCQFVAIHGGLVKAQNCPEGGVAFTIHLPLAKALRSAA